METFLNEHGEAVLTFLITSIIAAIKRHHDKKVIFGSKQQKENGKSKR